MNWDLLGLFPPRATHLFIHICLYIYLTTTDTPGPIHNTKHTHSKFCVNNVSPSQRKDKYKRSFIANLTSESVGDVISFSTAPARNDVKQEAPRAVFIVTENSSCALSHVWAFRSHFGDWTLISSVHSERISEVHRILLRGYRVILKYEVWACGFGPWSRARRWHIIT